LSSTVEVFEQRERAGRAEELERGIDLDHR
jgi:hypothetical protein